MDILERVAIAQREAAKTFADNPYLVIHVDLDNTLTKKTCWTEGECLNAEPNEQMVEMVKHLSKSHVVIIYTARADNLFSASNIWLKKQGIRCPLSNNKEPTTLYIDDKSFNPFEKGNCIVKNDSHKAWLPGGA